LRSSRRAAEFISGARRRISISCRATVREVTQSVPDFEQRLSNLQEQMERLRPVPSSGDPDSAEQRLALLTDQCAEIVRRWAVTSERHARAVSRFESQIAEWNDAGNKIQQDAAARIQALEQLVQHEREDLRALHEEPVRQLHDQAASLTQVCIATASAAQQHFERSEARLAAIENEFTRRMTTLAGEIQAVVAELRTYRGQTPQVPQPSSPWSLEGVTRLHSQMRKESVTGDEAALVAPQVDAPVLAAKPVAGLLPESASAITDRLDTLERTLTERDASYRATEASLRETVERAAPPMRMWGLAAAALAVVVLGAAGFAWKARSDVRVARERVEQAERDTRAATDAAAREVAASRAQAAEEIKAAASQAERARMIGDVLAAPDLVRYTLIGQSPLPTATARLYWSRSRGLVFSGSRMAPAPADSTYQVWLITRGGAVSAASFAPDAGGAATVAIAPPRVPRAVIGAMVTIEPSAGSTSPSDTAVLVREPPPV
jgi:hypothetical protein